VAIYLANKHTDLSTVQIGRNVGGRNHATVMHSISQVKNLMDIDAEVRHDINEIEAIL
jgi:chromosomal replication initiator protein